MDLPSRIPVLRDNPMFILEARRVWRGPPALVGVVLVLGIEGGVALFGWDEARAASWPTHIADACLVGWFVLGWLLALGVVPALLGGAISREREEGRLDGIIVTGLPASSLLSGKLAVVAIPLVVLLTPMALYSALAGSDDISTGTTALFVIWALGAPLTACLISLSVSASSGRTRSAIPAAYVAVWAAATVGWVVTLVATRAAGPWKPGYIALLTAQWLVVMGCVGWWTAVRALRRLGASG